MEADEAVGQLNGLAFEELGLPAEALAQLGVVSSGGSGRLFDRSQIYNDKFEEDAIQGDDYDSADDLEKAVDREIDQENEDRAHQRGLEAVTGSATSNKRLLDEDEDYDEDYDEEEEDPGQQKEQQNGVVPMDVDQKPAIKQEDDQPAGVRQESMVTSKTEDADADADADADGEAEIEEEEAEIAPTGDERGFNEHKVNLKQYYPSFEPGKILDYTELFAMRPSKRPKFEKSTFKVNVPLAKELPRAPSTKDYPSSKTIKSTYFDRILDDFRQKTITDTDTTPHGDIIYERLFKNNESSSKNHFNLPSLNEVTAMYYSEIDFNHQLPDMDRQMTFMRNASFEAGDWTKNIIWNSDQAPPVRKLVNEQDALYEQEEKSAQLVLRNNNNRQTLDPFNLSNDKFYEIPREAKKIVRQTFGHLEVQHAYPAQKLQLPFYKTRLQKSEQRSFHRPTIQFPTNVTFRFSKTRSAKKKKDKNGKKLDSGQAIQTTSDLSLRDTSSFVLCEFSEEAPPVINNFGMGSIIVNYYRKKNERDDYVPKLDLGEPFLLDPSDESPFMKFGNVNPGQTIPALYNNLIRAPLFRHQPADTDFLLIRNTINNETKYYLRQINKLFVVGQTYPIVEVPGPNSRKISSFTKHRLMIIVFRLLKKSKHGRLNIKRLLKYFTDQTDLQMRQRLKDFMEYNRKGDNRGWWTLKPHIPLPEKDEMLKMAEPETAVLCEAMGVGVRVLQDAGYSGQDDDKGKDDEESKLPLETQLAPWNTTKNFILASQNKAWLRLHGEGDPSGRGEAFSFLRASMKEAFLRPGETKEMRQAELEGKSKWAHKININEQNQIYRSEIDRIWKAQYTSLSNKTPPELTAEDEARWKSTDASDTPMGGASPFSRDETPDREDKTNTNNRILKIRRKINGKWTSETVRDPAVISAYLRQRQLIEQDQFTDEELVPTNDEEKNKLLQKKIQARLDKMRKNQDRRLQRKKADKSGAPGEIRGETTRRCGNCGQIGHMKTNRACPRWAEFNGPQVPQSQNSGNPAAGVAPGLNPFGGLGFMPPPPVSGQPQTQPGTPNDASTPQSSQAKSPPPPTSQQSSSVDPPAPARPKLKLTFAKPDS